MQLTDSGASPREPRAEGPAPVYTPLAEGGQGLRTCQGSLPGILGVSCLGFRSGWLTTVSSPVCEPDRSWDL